MAETANPPNDPRTPRPPADPPAEPPPPPSDGPLAAQPPQPTANTPAPQSHQPTDNTSTPQPTQAIDDTVTGQPHQRTDDVPAPQPPQPTDDTPAAQPHQPTDDTPAAQPHRPTDDALVVLLRQLTVETDRFAEMFGEAHGLHRTDLNALAVIMDAARRDAPMSPSRLADALHLSPSATTSVLDRLERAGHLRRDRSPTDRRKVELRMNDQARELGAAFFTPLNTRFTEAWQDLTDTERDTIARFLRASIAATVKVRQHLLRET